MKIRLEQPEDWPESDGLFHAYTLSFDEEDYSYAGAFLLDKNARPLCESIQSE